MKIKYPEFKQVDFSVQDRDLLNKDIERCNKENSEISLSLLDQCKKEVVRYINHLNTPDRLHNQGGSFIEEIRAEIDKMLAYEVPAGVKKAVEDFEQSARTREEVMKGILVDDAELKEMFDFVNDTKTFAIEFCLYLSHVQLRMLNEKAEYILRRYCGSCCGRGTIGLAPHGAANRSKHGYHKIDSIKVNRCSPNSYTIDVDDYHGWTSTVMYINNEVMEFNSECGEWSSIDLPSSEYESDSSNDFYLLLNKLKVLMTIDNERWNGSEPEFEIPTFYSIKEEREFFESRGIRFVRDYDSKYGSKES